MECYYCKNPATRELYINAFKDPWHLCDTHARAMQQGINDFKAYIFAIPQRRRCEFCNEQLVIHKFNIFNGEELHGTMQLCDECTAAYMAGTELEDNGFNPTITRKEI